MTSTDAPQDTGQAGLSIVVPLRNARAWATEFGRAFRGESPDILSEVELLLIDDASSDSSLDYFLSSLPPGLSVVSLRLEDQVGPGVARNKGLARASREYVCFWDCDDVADLGVYLSLVHTLEEQSREAGCVGYAIKDVLRARQVSWPGIDGDCRLLQLIKDRPAVWRFIFRRTFLNDYVMRFPEMAFGEDLVFLLRCDAVLNGEVSCTSTVGYTYMWRDGASLSSTANGSSQLKLLQELDVCSRSSVDLETQEVILTWVARVWLRARLRTKFHGIAILFSTIASVGRLKSLGVALIYLPSARRRALRK